MVQRIHARIIEDDRSSNWSRSRPRSRPSVQATPRFAELAEIIESVPGPRPHHRRRRSSPAMPELGHASNKIDLRPCSASRPTTTTAAKRRGERQIKGGRRRDCAIVFYMACLGAATRHNSGPEGVLSIAWSPKVRKRRSRLVACMRKLIDILNIMIERRQKVGSQPLRSELTERAITAFGLATERMPNHCRPVSGRGQGRQPPKAVARSASLEAGRSPGYFNNTVAPR